MAIEKSAGFALLAGSLLMLSTMILHPEGGNLQHLLKVARIVVISHSIGSFSHSFARSWILGINKKNGC